MNIIWNSTIVLVIMNGGYCLKDGQKENDIHMIFNDSSMWRLSFLIRLVILRWYCW